jgi:shikimate O-hydroxycinnamoyltransferase
MQTIPLSPIDHIFTGSGAYPIEFIFAYDGHIDPDRLQSSLRATLKSFAPLSSRLCRLSEQTYGLKLTDEGLVFQTSTTSIDYQEANDYSDYLDSAQSLEGEALTRIKLTQAPRGFVLGVSISHAVVDGFSYFHFLSSWSRIFHGKSILPPFPDRRSLIPSDADTEKDITRGELLSRCGLFWYEKRPEIPRDQVQWERILLSDAALNELVAEAQQACEVRLSRHDVISAFLWKKYLPKWGGNKDDVTTYASIPFDFRRILDALPDTYLGCAVSLAVATADRDTVIQASHGELALRIRKAINRITPEYIRESLATLESIRRQRGPEVLEEMHVLNPYSGILVTNLSRLPIQQLDFGTGIPREYQILTPAERGAVILPAAEGVDIRVFYPSGVTLSGEGSRAEAD